MTLPAQRRAFRRSPDSPGRILVGRPPRPTTKLAEVRSVGPLRDPAIAGRLAAAVAAVLLGSPFEHRSRWSSAVVILRSEERRVTSRGDFAGWLAAADLGAAARECTTRQIPSGRILVWLEVDAAEVAAAGFVVLDLATALDDPRTAT